MNTLSNDESPGKLPAGSRALERRLASEEFVHAAEKIVKGETR